MKHIILIILLSMITTSCAYVHEEGIQELTVLTPGAQNTVCYVYVDNLKYKFRPPQTQTIIKSPNDLIVDCLAPGNRRRDVVIASRLRKETKQNIVNAGIGATWDMASNAAYYYPYTVEVDFTYMPVQSESLPAHNYPDIKQPEDYHLEEFLPGTPKLNSDMEKIREDGAQSYPRREKPDDAPKDKGDLMDVIKQMF